MTAIMATKLTSFCAKTSTQGKAEKGHDDGSLSSVLDELDREYGHAAIETKVEDQVSMVMNKR